MDDEYIKKPVQPGPLYGNPNAAYLEKKNYNKNKFSINGDRPYPNHQTAEKFTLFNALKSYKRQNKFSVVNNHYIKGILIIFLMVLSLNVVVIAGINIIPYPFSSEKNFQTTGNQTLQSGGAYYDSKFFITNSTINYAVNSSNSISFAIWNTSVQNLPRTNLRKIYNIHSIFNVQETAHKDYFLFKGDVITYNFTLVNSLDLFLLNKEAFNIWNNSDFSDFQTLIGYDLLNGILTGSFTIPQTGEYYFVFYNNYTPYGGRAPPNYNLVNMTLQFNCSTPDFTKSELKIMQRTTIPANIFIVQKPGNYTALIYSFYTNSSSLSTIVYTSGYKETFSALQEWSMNLQEINTLALLIEVLIIALVINDIKKNYEKYLKEITDQEKHKMVQKESQVKIDSENLDLCPKCGLKNSPDAYYCLNCGSKLRAGKFIT